MQFSDIEKIITQSDGFSYGKNTDNTHYFMFTGKYLYKIKIAENLEAVNTGESIYDFHFFRLLKIKYGDKLILNDSLTLSIIDYGLSLMDNLCDFCTICSVELNIKTDNVYWCDSDTCQYVEEGLLTDNFISKKISENFIATRLITDVGMRIIESDIKRLFPFPMQFVKNKTKYTRKSILDIKDDDYYNILAEFYNSNKELLNDIINNMMSFIDGYKTDVDLYYNYGEKVYGLVKFLIRNIYYDIHQLDKNFIMGKNFKNIGADIYEIKYPEYLEKKFSDGKLLYHGSSFGNWFSIIRNGLKNMSNTKFMSSGSAYGQGIYFSNNFNTSYSYSTKFNNSKKEYIVGVAKILNESTYDKKNSFWVVDKDYDVLLKYIIVTKNNLDNTNITDFINTYDIYQKAILGEFYELINKRVNKEIEKLEKKYGSDIDINKDSSLISINLKKYNIDIEISIPNTYPCDPPSMYIKSKLKSKTEKKLPLTSDGKIVCKSVHPHVWNCKTNLIKIIEELEQYFI